MTDDVRQLNDGQDTVTETWNKDDVFNLQHYQPRRQYLKGFATNCELTKMRLETLEALSSPTKIHLQTLKFQIRRALVWDTTRIDTFAPFHFQNTSKRPGSGPELAKRS